MKLLVEPLPDTIKNNFQNRCHPRLKNNQTRYFRIRNMLAKRNDGVVS